MARGLSSRGVQLFLAFYIEPSSTPTTEEDEPSLVQTSMRNRESVHGDRVRQFGQLLKTVRDVHCIRTRANKAAFRRQIQSADIQSVEMFSSHGDHLGS